MQEKITLANLKEQITLKGIWWGILVVGLGVLFLLRYGAIFSEKPTFFDTVIFLVWVSVCLAPVFKEMKFFGLEFKQDIKKLEDNLSSHISTLQNELSAKIDVSCSNNNNIHVNTSAPHGKDLDKVKEEIEVLKEQLASTKVKGISVNTNVATGDNTSFMKNASDDTVQLVTTRLVFEKLFEKYNACHKRRYSILAQMDTFAKTKGLPPEAVSGLRGILSICNAAAHGVEVSEEQVALVKSEAETLYEVWREALEKPDVY